MAVKLTRIETYSMDFAYEYMVDEMWLKDLNGRLAALYVGDEEPMCVTEEDIKAMWNGEPFSLAAGSAWLQENYRVNGIRVSGYYYVMSQLMDAVKAMDPLEGDTALVTYKDIAE